MDQAMYQGEQHHDYQGQGQHQNYMTYSSNEHEAFLNSRHRNDPGVVQTIVKAACAANNLFLKNCNMCTVYCDKQVEYESVLEQCKNTVSNTAAEGSRTLEHLFKSIDTSSQTEVVQYHKQYLFDEESVVRQVHSRSEDDDGEP